MPESDEFWAFYWEMRLQAMETLGKRAAVLAVSHLIRELTREPGNTARLLELGCGEAQIIGALAEGHAQAPGIQNSVGVDYNPRSLAQCRSDYPRLRFVEGDFTDPDLLSDLGNFDIVLLVNALHEVFSACHSEQLGEVDVPIAKARVEQALAGAVDCLAPGGWVALFDGLEPVGDPFQPVQIRFLDWLEREHFTTFAREYHPFQITYREVNSPLCVELTRRAFTRYITKSIFLGKSLWKTEQLESYQYFTEEEFRQAFARAGLEIRELRTLTVDEDKWQQKVEILTPGVTFPQEHILILARRTA